MAIWVWIAAAFLISRLVLGKRKVSYEHYIWMMMPIDMYGVTVEGAVIKPYMIFGAFIILGNILKKRNIKIPVIAFIIVVLLMISDCANGFIIESFMQHMMFDLVLLIAVNYIIALEKNVNLDEIRHVAISTTIGFGAVFILAYAVLRLGLHIEGVFSTNRFAPGMFLELLNTGGISETRLRGFAIDPNTVITTLIPGACFSFHDILRETEGKVKNAIALALYALVVVLSGSRMGMACSTVFFAILFVSVFQKSRNKPGWIIALLLALTIMMETNLLEKVFGFVLKTYEERAALTSESGRFTIWMDNALLLLSHNRLFFGVGQNQIQHLASTGLECHNTWLEWICGAGLIGGGIAVYWFLSVPPIMLRRARSSAFNAQSALPLMFAYCAICLCITSVDNITNSSLIFLSVIGRMGNLRIPSGQGVL